MWLTAWPQFLADVLARVIVLPRPWSQLWVVFAVPLTPAVDTVHPRPVTFSPLVVPPL